MRMTFSRWCIGVGLGCVAVAALVLPFPDAPRRQWTSATAAPLAAEVAKLVRASGDAYFAVRRYRAMRALDRWRRVASDDTVLVRVDSSVPAAARNAVRAVAADQWAAMIPRVSAAHAEIFIYVDSSSIARAGGSESSRRALEPRRFVDVSFALPAAVEAPRCVVMVRLRGTSDVHLNALRNESLIGVCGFFAAFGLPGQRVRSWLDGERYRFARRSDWTVARAPAIDASTLYALGEPGARCLTGATRGCDGSLGLDRLEGDRPVIARDRADAVLDAVGPGAFATRHAERTLGEAEGELLADLVRDVGPDRFARFWASDAAPADAFMAATGESFSAWTRRWLARTYGPLPERPAPRRRDVVWLLLAAALALVIAARPRQLVLSDRLAPFRA